MKTNPDQDDPMLDAVLRDESWQTNNAAFKAAVLGTFRAQRHVRRLARWTTGVLALVAVVAVGIHWLGTPRNVSRQIAANVPAVPSRAPKPHELTDAELLAAFPKGSCFIAEVDGKKELVFFDPAVERQYIGEIKSDTRR